MSDMKTFRKETGKWVGTSTQDTKDKTACYNFAEILAKLLNLPRQMATKYAKYRKFMH